MLFGCCFPLGSILFLYASGYLGMPGGFIEAAVRAHANSLIYIIDSAPVFLGLLARFAGIRQDRLQRLMNSLEQQVQEKTESLRVALEEAHKANVIITHMAEHDGLTGLLSRRRFQVELEAWIKYALRYNRQGTLVFIDLDKFKYINDTFGHASGDQYLVRVANLLANTLRSTDILARWGGDEFVAFLPEITGKEAQQVGSKLLDTFAQNFFVLDGQSFPLSASIGLAYFPEHTEDANELVIFADDAMYDAKRSGKGCWRLYAPPANL